MQRLARDMLQELSALLYSEWGLYLEEASKELQLAHSLRPSEKMERVTTMFAALALAQLLPADLLFTKLISSLVAAALTIIVYGIPTVRLQLIINKRRKEQKDG